MKVMMFTGAVPRMPSGVGDYVGELQRALAGRVDLSVVTTDSAQVDASLMPGARVYPVARSWGLSDLAAIGAAVTRERPDLFHQQYPAYMGGPTNRAPLSNFLPAWLKARFRRVPLVTTFHEFGERRLRWRARAAPNLLLSDALITITARDQEILSRWKKRVARIPIMSNIPATAPAARRGGGAGAAVEAVPGPSRVAYFGFVEPLKGFERFVEVAERLGGEAFEYVVIGGFRPESVPYHRSLLERVRRAGLEQSFRFLGHLDRDEVAARLAESRCCLLPFEEGVSERRGSFLAAVVQGTPVVTTAGPFTPAEFRGVPGIAVLPKEDVAGLAAAVRDFCGRRPDGAGLARIAGGVALEAIAEGHLALYAEVLGRGRDRNP